MPIHWFSRMEMIMRHSWRMPKTHRDCVFLVDTYDTLKAGVPSAIRVAREMGDKINFLGVRIDSGDMAYISKRVREQLDEAGFTEAKKFMHRTI